MTFRERIADWISGGELTRARERWKAWRRNCFETGQTARRLEVIIYEREDGLRAIECATRNGKSGTAIKINRMAREALQ